MTYPLCRAPWINIDISPTGRVLPCCVYTPAKDTKPYKVDNIDGWLQSDELRKLKEDLSNGIKPVECESCWRNDEVSAGIRFGYNSFPINEDYLASNLTQLQIKSLDLKLGNQCNLQCIMCSPYSSDKILEYELNTTKHNIKGRIWLEAIKESTSWPTRFDISSLVTKFPNVTFIKFTGGEPFVNPHIIPFLSQLDKKHKIYLFFVTNLTLINEKLLNVLSAFRKVEFVCSIDGTSDVYEFIRQPASWDVFCKNLQLLKSSMNNATFSLNCTMQAANSLDLHNIIQFAKSHNIKLRLQLVQPFDSIQSLNAVNDVAKAESIRLLKELDESDQQKYAINALSQATFSQTAYNIYKANIEKLVRHRGVKIPSRMYI